MEHVAQVVSPVHCTAFPKWQFIIAGVNDDMLNYIYYAPFYPPVFQNAFLHVDSGDVAQCKSVPLLLNFMPR